MSRTDDDENEMVKAKSPPDNSEPSITEIYEDVHVIDVHEDDIHVVSDDSGISDNSTITTIQAGQKDLSDYLVTQSNKLVMASYKLSLQENRLILAAISKLDSRKIGMHPRKTLDQSTVVVEAVEFAKTFGISNKKVYEELKTATNNLFERKITQIDGQKTTKMRWVSKVVYHEGEGWVELQFSPDVLNHLTLLKNNFSSSRLASISGLKTSYSQRIRMMCEMFVDTGIFRIPFDKFRESLQIPYKSYSDVKRRVLEPSLKEIRGKSDLIIDCSAYKRGRSVTTLEFRIKRSPQQVLDLEDE